MERVDRRTRFLSRISEAKPADPSGSVSNTDKSPQMRMVSVRLEDCSHKLGPNGVFIVQGPVHHAGVEDSDEDDDDDGDGRDSDYIPDSKRLQYCSRGRGRGSSSGKRTHKDQGTSASTRNYSCNRCRKTFSQLNHLKLHERTHTKRAFIKSPRESGGKGKTKSTPSTPYSCDLCSKTYSQLNHLKLHQRTHKGGQEKEKRKSSQTQSNKCDLCGKVFSSQAYISIHKRIHTGEKRYSCSVCGKAFTQASARTVHQRKHDKESSSLADVRPQQGRQKRSKQTVGGDDQQAQSAESLETPKDAETRGRVENGEECSLDNAVPQQEDVAQ
ncbi:uncharacterized protein LOC143129594 [Alosa pseudoharengus]|uniref:uncharacterized protein LOC143129594 n=1 Tax=Alosa pseudoharengus TaxID=34774 RepID=UPI003F88BF5D